MFSRYAINEGVIRVLGIDPSTTNMGVSICDINLHKQEEKIKLIYSNTIFGEQVKFDIPKQFDDTSTGTGVLARSYGLSRALKELLNIYEPNVAICEDNFLSMSAGTFKQLIQAVGLMREACNNANSPLHLSYVLPNLAKGTVGANFGGTQKEDVKKGVIAYPNLDNNGTDLNLLDEHSIDSLAITLYQSEMILNDYRLSIWQTKIKPRLEHGHQPHQL